MKKGERMYHAFAWTGLRKGKVTRNVVAAANVKEAARLIGMNKKTWQECLWKACTPDESKQAFKNVETVYWRYVDFTLEDYRLAKWRRCRRKTGWGMASKKQTEKWENTQRRQMVRFPKGHGGGTYTGWPFSGIYKDEGSDSK